VRRQLDDEVGIRWRRAAKGASHRDAAAPDRFPDATPDSLTVGDHEVFVRPRIAAWDIDLETHAMRIVLRSHEPEPRQQRALRV
jgi:hypothetical protein